MIQVKAKRKKNFYRVSHKLKKNEIINYLEKNLIEAGEIPELWPVEIHSGITGVKMQFILKNCIPFSEYLRQDVDFQTFCGNMIEIIDIIQNCEAHGISISNLELRNSYIYYDTENNKVIMLYWPIDSVKEYPNVRELFRTLAETFCNKESATNEYQELVNMLNKRDRLNLSEWKKQFLVWKNRLNNHLEEMSLYYLVKKCKIPLREFPFVVGRKEDICNYTVVDTLVSRQHFELYMKDNKVYIKDLNSSNGTYVNEEIIEGYEECLLKDGSIIRVGNQTFKFIRG